MPLVEYAGSSSDEEPQTTHSKSKTKKSEPADDLKTSVSTASKNMTLNPAPAVENSRLFTSGVPANSSKELVRNLPLNELTKPIQGENEWLL